MLTFIVTVGEDGKVLIDKAVDGWTDYKRDETFTLARMSVGDSLDLHTKTGPQNADPFSRLVRIAVEDDTIPKFTSIEEAEAWMEQRKGLTIL